MSNNKKGKNNKNVVPEEETKKVQKANPRSRRARQGDSDDEEIVPKNNKKNTTVDEESPKVTKKGAKKQVESDEEDESPKVTKKGGKKQQIESDEEEVPKPKKGGKKQVAIADDEEEVEDHDDEEEEDERANKKGGANKKMTARQRKALAAQEAAAAKKQRKNKRNQDRGKTLEELEEENEDEQADVPWYVELKGRYKLKNRDIVIDNLNVNMAGQVLIKENTRLALHYGKKYGLVGRNGLGKSVLIKKILSRDPELNIPDYMKLLAVEQEIIGDDSFPLDAVLAADIERVWLLKERDRLLEKKKLEADSGQHDEEEETRSYTIVDIFNRLSEIDSDLAESKAAAILAGLGFNNDEIRTKPTKNYSGGWRMRIAIARALFCQPDLLLLDEPNNHLDLEACIWLENYLYSWKKTLVVVSHDSAFLNEFVDNIIHLHSKTLTQYKGDYDTFVKVRESNRRTKKKNKAAQEKKEEHIKQFAQRNQNKQGKSRMRLLEKFEEITLDEDDPTLKFSFPDSGGLGPLPLKFKHVNFGYEAGKLVFKNLNFGIDTDSRIALVGRNGVGKSTLMNLMEGSLEPTSGEIDRDRHMRIARFHQHHVDQLTYDETVMDYIRARFPDAKEQEVRQHVAKFGLTGGLPHQKISTLSGGQKSRVVFAELAWRKPHIMLLDEPSNHLDVETIESFAKALGNFDGGVVLISHNQYLVQLVCTEIWVCGNNEVNRIEGDFTDYKAEVAKELGLTYV